MKKIIFCLLMAYPLVSFGQIGVKAGLNFSNGTNTSSISHSTRTCYNIDRFMAPRSKSIIRSKTKLILSKQGYNYSSNSLDGTADLLYIMLPTYLCINITRFFQIHSGTQMAYLINAKAHRKNTSGSTSPVSDAMQYYSRFDYGLGGGKEIYPFKGLLIETRMNISLANLYEDGASG
jgi:hypothetical protein